MSHFLLIGLGCIIVSFLLIGIFETSFESNTGGDIGRIFFVVGVISFCIGLLRLTYIGPWIWHHVPW